MLEQCAGAVYRGSVPEQHTIIVYCGDYLRINLDKLPLVLFVVNVTVLGGYSGYFIFSFHPSERLWICMNIWSNCMMWNKNTENNHGTYTAIV